MLSSTPYALATVAGLIAANVVSPASAAYPMSTLVSVPVTATDGTAAARQVTYTTLAVPSGLGSNLPNGSYLGNSSIVVGTLSTATNTTSVFAYDAVNGFRIVGLYTANANLYHGSAGVRGANNVGQVIGNSGTYDPNDTSFSATLGQTAWLYTTNGPTVSLGLTGANLSYTNNTTTGTVNGTYRLNQADFLNDSGQVVGYTNRYAGTGATTALQSASLGKSVWMYNAGLTTEIGLFGTGYSFAAAAGRSSSNTDIALNRVGQAVGNATVYLDKGDGTNVTGGQDGWIYSAGTNTAVGLYNAGATPTGTGLANASYNATNTSGTFSVPLRNTVVSTLSAGGIVGGSSSYYNGTTTAIGTDAFIYNSAAATYRQVGLTTNSYVAGGSTQVVSYVNGSGARNSTVNLINDAGRTAGTSLKYAVSATGGFVAQGTDAWTADANGNTVQTGLYDARHTNANGLSTEAVTALTQTGLIAGYATRYVTGSTFSTLGQDAFVVDTSTNTTYTIDPNSVSSNYQFSQVLYLSDNGYAAGIYRLSNGVTTSNTVNYAFLWSLAGGFVDLGSNVSPSLTSAGFASLITAYYTNGTTVYSTANSVASGAVTAIVAVTVPEPVSLSVLALGATALLRRRRA